MDHGGMEQQHAENLLKWLWINEYDLFNEEKIVQILLKRYHHHRQTNAYYKFIFGPLHFLVLKWKLINEFNHI